MEESILVTGGAGYIGSHLVRKLIKEKRQVVVLDNLVYGHIEALPKTTNFYKGEISDKELLGKIFRTENITHVMHFAAYAYVGESVTDPLKYYSNNVASTIKLLESMRECHVKNIIFSSSCATYGDPQYLPLDEKHPQAPINPYGTTKLMIEKVLKDLCAQSQITYGILRYFNAAGADLDGSFGEDHRPETHLIPLILQVALGQRDYITIFGEDYNTPDGTCLRDYVHIEDLADAHIKAIDYLTTKKESFEANLGTGKPISIKEMIEVCRKITGHPIPAKSAARRPGDPSSLYANNIIAKEKLGWTPKHSDCEKIISSAWAWHNTHPKGYASTVSPKGSTISIGKPKEE